MSDERRFRGINHLDVLSIRVEDEPHLVTNLIEVATVGTVAGLPESHKSFLATGIAHKAAAGGHVLGRFEVAVPIAVGYWWQDDSTGNEMRRIQAYANRHGHTGNLSIRWHLNEGLRLPADTDELAAVTASGGEELIILDSLYNFIPGVALKEEDVALVYAALKAKVCDELGCAVLIVDHAAWPTDSNRGQRRAYGSVFKAAAIRWGIYIERDGDKLWVEVRGNNIPGLKRHLAVWDDDALELRLVDQEASGRDLAAEIEEWLTGNPHSTKNAVTKGVGAGKARVSEILANDPRFAFEAGPRGSQLWVVTDWFRDAQNQSEPVPGLDGSALVPTGCSLRSRAPVRTSDPAVVPATSEPVANGSVDDEEIDQAAEDGIAWR